MIKLLILFLPFIISFEGCGKKNQANIDVKSKGNLKEEIIKRIVEEDLQNLKILLEDEKYNLNEIEGEESYLTIALSKSNEEIINFLISKGADPNLIINGKSILLISLEKNRNIQAILKLVQNEKFKIDSSELEKIAKILIEKDFKEFLMLLIEKEVINFDFKIEGKSLLESSKEKNAFLSQIALMEKLFKRNNLIWEILQVYEKIPSSEKELKNSVLSIFKQKFKEIVGTITTETEDKNREFLLKKLILSKISVLDEMNEELEYMIVNDGGSIVVDQINNPQNSPMFKAIEKNALKNILTLVKQLKNSDNNFSFIKNSFAINFIKNLKINQNLLNDFSLDIFNNILEEIYNKKINFYEIKNSNLAKIKEYILKNDISKLDRDLLNSTSFLLYNSFPYPEIFKILLKYIQLDKDQINYLIYFSLVNVNIEIFEILVNNSNQTLIKEHLLEIILEGITNFNKTDDYIAKSFDLVSRILSQKLLKVEDKSTFSRCILSLVEMNYIIVFEDVNPLNIRDDIEKNDNNKKRLIELLRNSIILKVAGKIEYTEAIRVLFEIFEINIKEVKTYYKKINLLDTLIRENNLALAKFLIENDFEITYNNTISNNISRFIKENYIYGPETLIVNVKKKAFKIIKLFFEKNIVKINVNYIDKNWKTALDYLEDRNSELYKYLKERKAKTSQEINNQIQTELEEQNRKKEETKNKNISKTSKLIKKKDVTSIENNTNTPNASETFKKAIEDNDFNLIKKYILEDNRKIFEILDKNDLLKDILKFVDIKILNNSGDNLLFAAIKNNFISAVKILISSGEFNIKEKDSNGNTILMASIPLESDDLFKHLTTISKEIFNDLNNKNENILDIAVENRKTSIINFILNNPFFEKVNGSTTLTNLVLSKDEKLQLEILKKLLNAKFSFEKKDIEKLILYKKNLTQDIRDFLAKNFKELRDLAIQNEVKFMLKNEEESKEEIKQDRKIKVYSKSDWAELENANETLSGYRKIIQILKNLIKGLPVQEKVIKKIEEADNLYEIKVKRTRVFYMIDNDTIVILKVILNKDDSKTASAIINAKKNGKYWKTGEYSKKFEDLDISSESSESSESTNDTEETENNENLNNQ